jgi:hypothetical protein
LSALGKAIFDRMPLYVLVFVMVPLVRAVGFWRYDALDLGPLDQIESPFPRIGTTRKSPRRSGGSGHGTPARSRHTTAFTDNRSPKIMEGKQGKRGEVTGPGADSSRPGAKPNAMPKNRWNF